MTSAGDEHCPGAPLRVLHVIPGAAETPSFVFAKRQCDALERSGVDVRRFFLASRTAPGVLLREQARLRREEDAWRPDVTHAQYGTMTAFFTTRASRRPVVVTFRGSDLNPAPSDPWPRHAVGHLLSQLAAQRAARIVCVSAELRARLWFASSRAKTDIITDGMDLDLFQLMPRAEARTRLGWADADRLVLFNAGRAPRVKRLDLAEAAVRAAARRGSALRLVTLDGRQPPERIPLMLCAADCLLVTSDYEGSPTIVKEAMACNLPVVSVVVGDVADQLRDVEPSRLAPRDAEALGRALADMTAAPRRSNGRDKIRATLLESQVTARLMACYRRAARPAAAGEGA